VIDVPPPTAARSPLPRSVPGAGVTLALIRNAGIITRAELMAATGLSRSTMTQRLEQLLAHGLIVEAGAGAGTTRRGRPPATFAFNPQAGVILSAGMGATHGRLGLTDLEGGLIAELSADLDMAQPPDDVMAWTERSFLQLLRDGGREVADVAAIGIGVPAPVEYARGTTVNPPLMPGWDGYSIADRLGATFPVPVLVDNDVNSMAWGEHVCHLRDTSHMLFIKVGHGIGLGIVANGSIQRGADGAAGDIGHLPIAAAEGVRCECGNTGCLEAVASGRAMARQLREHGATASGSRDVVALARSGDPRAMALIRNGGRLIGEALVSAVNLLNPRVIVIGGDIAHADHLLLAGVREVIYQRSLPLATRHLRIVRSKLDDRAGVVGAAMLAIEHVLAPATIDRALAASEAEPAPPPRLATA
jgi:predicted NBD/HSP70 family sugar kinase